MHILRAFALSLHSLTMNIFSFVFSFWRWTFYFSQFLLLLLLLLMIFSVSLFLSFSLLFFVLHSNQLPHNFTLVFKCSARPATWQNRTYARDRWPCLEHFAPTHTSLLHTLFCWWKCNTVQSINRTNVSMEIHSWINARLTVKNIPLATVNCLIRQTFIYLYITWWPVSKCNASSWSFRLQFDASF